ncbi:MULTISPECIES: AAA family ATPase [Lacticaseibacillus]|uniref:Phage NTP-binding protein n=2 Tax=Lacticaseibacillus casei TaxID=1582 RepID=A0AAD1ESG2_LACCA|nr:AAA family ATPase [Lacticaseibacillus casei]MBI6598239.1 AAA family ATPase [Lacticaseibacillus casei]MBO1482005.1 AAA family ATPase [Lacticaseibacillus casei]MBO2417480.1 AAA family ATPase [Lacticaseibacillus casei]MCK2081693.1 AAA family ATPase [Lacticaseibacillus casei]MED7631535.1 DNA-binding protein [Lacticaseibacillus casei]
MQPIKHASSIDRTKNWRVLIYGKPGVGKTSAIRNLDGKTLVLDLDDSSKVLSGATNIDVQPFDRSKPSEEWKEFLKNLAERVSGYDNLVIDNVSAFEKDWFVERGRASKNGIGNEIQDYGQWANYFARIMTMIFMDAPVNVLVTAWENTRDVTSETGQSFSQYAPAIRDSVRDGLLGLTDVVGRVVISTKTSHRGVILAGSDAIFAKNRLDDRTACAIEDLFKFGGDSDVSASSLPEGAS